MNEQFEPHQRPLDGLDTAILEQLAAIYDTLDPPPTTLDDTVLFALSLATLNAELATLLEGQAPALRAAETSATDSVTFTSSALQLMVSTAPEPDGSLRVDGWVTGGGLDVALYAGSTAHWATSDVNGRLLWRSIPHGPIRFLLRPADPEAKPVLTPVIEF
ncbi:carboxypeptidase regulatory-like domain-containing protein [Glutamicibacter sp. AOP5-A2-7]